MAFSLTRDLVDAGLAEELARRLQGARWRVEVEESRLVQPPATDSAIVDAARRLLLDRGWDVAVCLTDLPLHIHRRPSWLTLIRSTAWRLCRCPPSVRWVRVIGFERDRALG